MTLSEKEADAIYEKAIEFFEAREFEKALAILAPLVESHDPDSLNLAIIAFEILGDQESRDFWADILLKENPSFLPSSILAPLAENSTDFEFLDEISKTQTSSRTLINVAKNGTTLSSTIENMLEQHKGCLGQDCCYNEVDDIKLVTIIARFSKLDEKCKNLLVESYSWRSNEGNGVYADLMLNLVRNPNLDCKDYEILLETVKPEFCISQEQYVELLKLIGVNSKRCENLFKKFHLHLELKSYWNDDITYKDLLT